MVRDLLGVLLAEDLQRAQQLHLQAALRRARAAGAVVQPVVRRLRRRPPVEPLKHSLQHLEQTEIDERRLRLLLGLAAHQRPQHVQQVRLQRRPQRHLQRRQLRRPLEVELLQQLLRVDGGQRAADQPLGQAARLHQLAQHRRHSVGRVVGLAVVAAVVAARGRRRRRRCRRRAGEDARGRAAAAHERLPPTPLLGAAVGLDVEGVRELRVGQLREHVRAEPGRRRLETQQRDDARQQVWQRQQQLVVGARRAQLGRDALGRGDAVERLFGRLGEEDGERAADEREPARRERLEQLAQRRHAREREDVGADREQLLSERQRRVDGVGRRHQPEEQHEQRLVLAQALGRVAVRDGELRLRTGGRCDARA